MAPKITVPKAQKLSILLIVVAISYFYAQVDYDFGWEKSKVDENAVQSEWVKPILAEKFKNKFGANEDMFRSKCSSMPDLRQWIAKQWNAYSIQNYVLKRNNDSAIIYGIHKSPFSDGKTATIIGLSYDLEQIQYECNSHYLNNHKTGLSSIAAFLTISTALSTVNWLSKDIIFVLIERNNFSSKSQQSQHSSYALFESFVNEIIPKHASLVVGAIIIEVPLYYSSQTLGINVAGPIGFQPNYDIVATSIVVFSRNHFKLNVCPYLSKPNSFWNHPWSDLRKSMMRCMAAQSVAKMNGYHGYFIRNRIDALSLVSIQGIYNNEKSAQNKQTMLSMVRSIELFAKAMSNLIEIFHHSTFNYILISQTKFITMAKYSIPIGLMGLSPLIESYAIYTNCYTQYLDKLLLSVLTLCASVLFGVYTYLVIFLVNNILSFLDLFYSTVLGIFLIVIGIVSFIKLSYYFTNVYHQSNENCYASFQCLLILYSMFSQMWLPIALNFSIGLYFVTITTFMLFSVRQKAKIIVKKKENIECIGEKTKDKTIFLPYGIKSKFLRMILLIALPIASIYTIMFIMDMSLFELITNLKFDLLDEDIYRKHPGWIVVFFTLIPTYFGCWFLLLFC